MSEKLKNKSFKYTNYVSKYSSARDIASEKDNKTVQNEANPTVNNKAIIASKYHGVVSIMNRLIPFITIHYRPSP